MARESGLWSWLAKARLHFKLSLHMHRIENPVSPGMPDVEGFLSIEAFAHSPPSSARLSHGQFWLELKSASRPVRAKTPVRFKMRPKQVEWARRRWKLGGACYWLLQVGDGGARRIYMLPGHAGADIDRGLTEVELSKADVLRFCFDPKVTPEMVITTAAAHS